MRVPVRHNGINIGYTERNTFVSDVDPKSLYRNGYLLPFDVLDELVDRGVEVVVLCEPARRLTSAIEDWQEFGTEVGTRVLLSLSYMNKD